MGEGGGEREDFRDTAFFKTVQTDSAGRAELAFDLPDNITSWRITWQAYAPGIYVGQGRTNIDASLDFFLDSRLAKLFLRDDEPKIGLRSAGRGIDPRGSTTTYTVEIPAIGFSETARGQANIWQEVPLPRLQTGEYRARITAENGAHRDAVNIEFSVIDSFASYHYDHEAALTSALRPAGSDRYPTTLYFSDKAYAQALQGLYRLAWQDGIRLEQKLASRIASDILAEEMGLEYYAFDEEADRESRLELLRYQQGNGGIASFTYAVVEDIEASVLAASVGKDYFDRQALAAYFYRVLERDESSDRDRLMAYWGLAALNEPVLLDIQALLSRPSMSGEGKLILAMALYYAGDGARALPVAKELIDNYTENLGREIRSNIGSDEIGEQTKATARLALLASVFDLPEEEGLFNYMMNNRYEGDYYLLEQAGINRSRALRLPKEDAGFTYTLDGNSKTVDLRSQTVYALLVLPEHLEQIRFSGISGDITVLSRFLKDGRPPDGDAAAGQLEIRRQINGSAGNAVTVGQRRPVQVTLEFSVAADAPAGSYMIKDILPAGLNFGRVDSHHFFASTGGNENKEVEFIIFKPSRLGHRVWTPHYYMEDGSLRGTIVYMAYPVMTGSFTAEAPHIRHSINDNVLVYAGYTRVTIE
jgi:hypothetical protein